MNSQSQKTIDVIIPIFNGYTFLNSCLNSVIQYFDNDARLILIDDSSNDPRIQSCLEDCQKQADFPVLIYKNSQNLGFVKTVNQGMQLSDQNDVILLNSDTIVTQNWIGKLRKAAYSKENVATVTPMSNNATIFSVPEFGKANQLPEGYDIDTFAELIENTTLRLYPEVPTGHGFCLYIKRTSLNLLGFFDESYGLGCEEENDFCMRVISHSLSNIMADDTFIYHAGRASYQDESRDQAEQVNRDKLLTKYPFYLNLIRYYQENRPRQIWDNIKAQIDGLRVGIDGRCLTQNISGTQRYLLELLKAYTEQVSSLQVDLLISNGSQEYIINLLKEYELMSFPNLLEESQLDQEVGAFGWDIFHVTFQGISLTDIVAIRPYAKRLVNTWQDFILFRNPSYFANFSQFENYRFNCRILLESMDGVIAISDYVKQEILNKNLLDSQRIKRIYHGIDENHESIQNQDLEKNIVMNMGLTPKRYLLFVGNDFLHKNLELTVKIFKIILNQGYDYQLAIVGKAVGNGGVIPELQQKIKEDITVKDKIIFLNDISDEALKNLYHNAGVLLYLSNAEGFGLPPLEAFLNNCPVIASKLTSIPEVVGEAASCFHPGEINKIASQAIRLIEKPSDRDRAIQQGKERLKHFNWMTTAKETKDFYYYLLRLPPNSQHNLPALHLNSQKLIPTQSQLEQTQSQLEQTQSQLEQKQSQLEQTQLELNQAYSQIEGMKASKFWKMREIWFQIKSWLKLTKSK